MSVTGSQRLDWRPRLSVSWVKRRSRGHGLERPDGRAVPGIRRVVRRRPIRGSVLGLGRWRPLRLLGELEGVQDVAPEALLSVDDLVDEARLPLGVPPVGRFPGVVRGPGRRRRRRWPVRWPVRGFVAIVGRDEGRSGRRDEWGSEMKQFKDYKTIAFELCPGIHP